MIPIGDILITQRNLKRASQISGLLFSYKEGLEVPKIKICLDEDDNFCVHDGHHRLFAIYSLGFSHLTTSEYEFVNLPARPTFGRIKDLK